MIQIIAPEVWSTRQSRARTVEKRVILADCAARRRDPQGGSALLVEVRWEQRDARQEEARLAQADHQALRQDKLPVFFADAGHHHAENDEERADEEQRAQVSLVEDGAGDEDADYEEAQLEGADP